MHRYTYPDTIPVRERTMFPGHRTVSDYQGLRTRMCEQLSEQGIRDPAVLHAMSTVPRHLFVQEAFQPRAYDNISLPIGFGQTISQPFTVALMTERLEISPGMHVLEIGTGSGYQAAVLATMGCVVFSIERISELYLQTRALLRHLGFESIHLQRGDGTLGFPLAAPFDRIIVTAGGPKIPEPLIRQLDSTGIMLIPVGSEERSQEICRVCRSGDSVRTESLGPAVFVNLVGDHGWEQCYAMRQEEQTGQRDMSCR